MKRFIAGASCPKCNQQDTLFFETSEAEDKVHCSRCEYSEMRATGASIEIEQSNEAEQESSIKWH